MKYRRAGRCSIYRPPRLPTARALLAAAAAVGAVGDRSVAYTSRAPAGGPRLRFFGDTAGASSASLPRGASARTRRGMCPAHEQRRPVSRACCRRSLARRLGPPPCCPLG